VLYFKVIVFAITENVLEFEHLKHYVVDDCFVSVVFDCLMPEVSQFAGH